MHSFLNAGGLNPPPPQHLPSGYATDPRGEKSSIKSLFTCAILQDMHLVKFFFSF